MAVNADDLDWSERDQGGTNFRRKQLGEAAGGEGIGASLYELPPGGRSWPYHYHEGNEEAIFVLAGEGTLRLADGEHPLESGDYVALPPGEESAHRVINDSGAPLRYLMVSTMDEPDVTVYPDAGTVGVYAGAPPGGRGERTLQGYFDLDERVPYPDEE